MKLADLTYAEVQARIEAGAVALWPTGATEAHGPHLPLATDVIIAEETCSRAEARIQDELGITPLVLPALSFSVAEFAAPFSGTISIPKETAIAYVRDVILSVAHQGFRAVCLVNAHLEPQHRFALRDAVKAAQGTADCPLTIADPCDKRWVPTLTAELQSGNCHAGQYETSLILAARRGLVRGDVKQLASIDIDLMAGMKAGHHDFQAMGADQAYFGKPADASIAEGEDSFDKLVTMVVTMLGEALRPGDPR